MSAVIIKICGLTRAEDIEAAVTSGVDVIGFVFAASPRRISAQTALKLSAAIPGGILRVGLFMNQDKTEIEQVINTVDLDMLQFHGNETEQECDLFGIPWLKAVAMADQDSAVRAERDFPSTAGLLLDSHSAGKRGGTGKVFDWSLSTPMSTPVWLAGGLNAENVAEAIRIVKPYAVDVSSGVEVAPGIKDAGRISKFINAVRAAESE